MDDLLKKTPYAPSVTEVSLVTLLPRLALFRRGRFSPMLRLTETAGSMIRVRAGRRHVWIANHPAVAEDILVRKHAAFRKDQLMKFLRRLLGEGLITSEGEHHDRQRKMIQPMFRQDVLKQRLPAIVRALDRTTRPWNNGMPVDMQAAMFELTGRFIGESLFSAGDYREIEELAACFESLLHFNKRYAILPLGLLLDRLPLPGTRRYNRAMQHLNRFANDRITHRTASDNRPPDWLTTLIEARDDTGCPMPRQQVRDEFLTLFLAGYETTATALSWSWHLLAQHPPIQERVAQEAGAVLGERTPAAADLPALETARNVFAEAMRLYPPSYVFGREALQDVEAAGHAMRKGDVLFLSPFLIQRNPRFFEEPQHFNPDRWQKLPTTRAVRIGYFPFGAGRRVCLGEPLAWMEGTLTLALICRDWRIHAAPHTHVRPAIRVGIHPHPGVPAVLERRG
ncbi:MAG: cytochrome P450 [Candidatus Hydrogenedentota bacterium]